MGERRIRRHAEPATGVEARCRRQLKDSGLWGLSDLSEICSRVSEMTDRRLVLSAMAFGGQPIHGLLVSTNDIDYVIYEANTSRFHQDHIVMHELSHVIWGHQGIVTRATDPQETARVLGRQGYDDIQEHEAELTASLMGQFIETAELPDAPVVDPVLARVFASFDLRLAGS